MTWVHLGSLVSAVRSWEVSTSGRSETIEFYMVKSLGGKVVCLL